LRKESNHRIFWAMKRFSNRECNLGKPIGSAAAVSDFSFAEGKESS